MTLDINIYTAPPPKADCERLRDSVDNGHILKLGSVFACLVAMAYIFFELDDPAKISRTLYWTMLFTTILLTSYTVWRYWKHLKQAEALVEAHPETMNALLVCANSSAVKAYCTSVKNQGRNLTMGEATELMKLCKTNEEIRKIADYYDAHNVRFPEYAVH